VKGRNVEASSQIAKCVSGGGAIAGFGIPLDGRVGRRGASSHRTHWGGGKQFIKSLKNGGPKSNIREYVGGKGAKRKSVTIITGGKTRVISLKKKRDREESW